MINRKHYLNKINGFISKDIIKVITGMRRSGKSIFLQQIIDKIESSNKIYLNFEDLAHHDLLDYLSLYAHLKPLISANSGKTYLFLDEIQMVNGWERLVSSLKATFDVDIYLTGSNATLLSGELATLIAGRYVSIEILPFSYAEYLEQQPSKTFQDYIVEGGMPMLGELADKANEKINILQDVYNTVVLKDIVSRNSIREPALLNQLLLYLFSEIGHVFSANNISNYLKSENRKVSTDTIINYLQAAENAFLIRKVKFKDAVGKKVFKLNEKYYITDHGLREALTGGNIPDIERILENIVYFELLRRGYAVTIGRVDNKEIDFIAEKSGALAYFQVSYLMSNESTRKREFGVYEKLRDNFPKYVLSMDKLNFSQNGIVHQNIEDWLLEDFE